MPISEWNAVDGARLAKRNRIFGVFGTPKSGKSQFATSTALPLYAVHLDPNNNLNEHLLARQTMFPGSWTAAPLYVPTLPYAALTKESCGEWVAAVQQYAADARARAINLDEPGVFVIDGGKRLKGYVEKWLLGESATLGYRAHRGDKGAPTQIQYAESNAFFNDLINAFVGSPLHVVITFEAKPVWMDFTKEDGSKSRRPSGRYEPAMPGGREGELVYTLTALIEALVEAVKGPVVDNKQSYTYEHKLRFDVMGVRDMAYLLNRTMPAMPLDTLLELLNSNIPADQVLDAPHEIVRVNMEGIEGEEE